MEQHRRLSRGVGQNRSSSRGHLQVCRWAVCYIYISIVFCKYVCTYAYVYLWDVGMCTYTYVYSSLQSEISLSWTLETTYVPS